MAMFGEPEMKRFVEETIDPRVHAMWRRLCKSKANAAKWNDHAVKMAAENARLREACQTLVSWADYGGDAVAMLDDAVELARQALNHPHGD